MIQSGDVLLVFGLGYSGSAVAQAAAAARLAVVATSRDPARVVAPAGVACIAFDDAGTAIAQATHLLATAPPEEAGDPALLRYVADIAAAPRLRWIGYFSTTGVYGDRAGGWVDETTQPAPGSPRTRRRVAAEMAWSTVTPRLPADLFRLGGIYGPGRSALDDVRAGGARRIVKPGHAFGRIHRDDIALAVVAAMRQDRPPGPRVLNLVDDVPEESARVIEEAAQLLGASLPPAVPFAQAREAMSPMARGFWSENRKVGSRDTQAALGIGWRYPSYREGLRAILAEEGGQGPA